MREAAKLGSFILLIIGTMGLLINEFVSDWGTPATIIFAVFNFVGLTILAYVNWGMKDKR